MTSSDLRPARATWRTWTTSKPLGGVYDHVDQIRCIAAPTNQQVMPSTKRTDCTYDTAHLLSPCRTGPARRSQRPRPTHPSERFHPHGHQPIRRLIGTPGRLHRHLRRVPTSHRHGPRLSRRGRVALRRPHDPRHPQASSRRNLRADHRMRSGDGAPPDHNDLRPGLRRMRGPRQAQLPCSRALRRRLRRPVDRAT